MDTRATLALILLALVPAAATATPVAYVDTVYVARQSLPLVYDGFDMPPLSSQWIPSLSEPAEFVDGMLGLAPGDSIFTLRTPVPDRDILAYTRIDVANLTGGQSALMLLTASPGLDVIGLGVTDQAAFLFSEDGLLRVMPLVINEAAELLLRHDADTGILLALVNDQPIYARPHEFGAFSGIGIAVVPEPATALVLGLGTLLLARRSRV